MSQYYYYEQNGNTYQVEADSYRRITDSSFNQVQLNWLMSAGPITATYDRPILAVASQGGTWKPNPSQNALPCPGSPAFEGNSINHPFDTAYTDNSGVCGYLVTLDGGNCKTNFYRAGAIVLTLNFCPPIDNDPRNTDCQPCCRSLLPSMQSISV